MLNSSDTTSQAGNLSYATANAAQTIVVAKAPQSIAFSQPVDRPFTFGPIQLSASTTAGLSPTFTVVSGSASVVGNQLTVSGVGPVVVRAAQAGNATYAAANPIDRTILITRNFDSWRHSEFSAVELNNTAVSGPNVVRNADGLSNLMRYALGQNSREEVASFPMTVTKAGATWQATYLRPTDRPDLDYSIAVSSDLTNWTTTGVSHQKIGSGTASDTWRGSINSESNIFFRLKVTRRPD